MKKRTRKPERNASRTNGTSKRKGKPPNLGATGALDILDPKTGRPRSSGSTSGATSGATSASSPITGSSKRDGLINGTIDGSMAGLSWGEGLEDDNGLIDIFDQGKPAGRSRGPAALALRHLGTGGADRRHLVAVSSLFLVCLLVTSGLLIILNSNDQEARIRIDGEFDDWEDAELFSDPAGDTDVLELDLLRMGVASDGLYLSFYLETVEPLFTGERGRTARVLIDADGGPDSGYSVMSPVVMSSGARGLDPGSDRPTLGSGAMDQKTMGFGTDYLVELYGRQGFVLTTVLYTFEQDGRSQLDWNGFSALTTVSARAGEVSWTEMVDDLSVPGGVAGDGRPAYAIETQVPLFDLGLEAGDEVMVLFQTSDDLGNSDLSDLVLSNLRGAVLVEPAPSLLVDHLSISDPNATDGTGITIDGHFADWAGVTRNFDDPNDVEDPDVDLLETAIMSDSRTGGGGAAGGRGPGNEEARTCFYLKVAGEALHGSVIPANGARSRPGGGGDSVGPPLRTVSQDMVPLPVLTGEDSIRLFVDVDSNASTGYSLLGEEASGPSLGAERMVELKGINGHLTQRTVHQWQGQEATEWRWSKGTLIEAAAMGSEVELAVEGLSLGEEAGEKQEDRDDEMGQDAQEAHEFEARPSYMVHITSWDGLEDRSVIGLKGGHESEEAGDDEVPSDGSTHGSRSSVTWPDTWTSIHTDDDDGLSGDVELLGLSYASDSDHWFFRVTTESDVDISDSTFGVFIDDVSSNDGTNVYDAAIAKYEATNDVTTDALLYHWDATGDDWDRDTIQGSDHIRVNEGSHHGVDLAFDKDDLDFTLDIVNDKVRAASIDSSHGDADEALETGQEWEGRNDPDYIYNDDVSGPTTIPEFSYLVMPVGGILMLVAGRRHWRMRC